MNGHETLVDRIMVAVLQEPSPTPTRALALAIRRGRLGDATASVWVAWHLATVQRPAIAPGIRARSLALVIAVVLSLGSITAVAAATARAVVEQAVLGSDSGRPALDAQRPALPGVPGDDGANVVEVRESQAPAPTEMPSTAPVIVEDDGGDDADRGGEEDDDATARDDDGYDDRAGGDDEDDAAEPTDGDDSPDDEATDEADDDEADAHDDSSAGESDSDGSEAETSSEYSGWEGSGDDD